MGCPKGFHHTEESKKAISIARKGKCVGENHPKPWFGKHHSEESNRKRSIARKGKCVGENHPFFGKPFPIEAVLKSAEARKKRPTKIQVKVAVALDHLGIQYEQEKFYRNHHGFYIVDFFIPPNTILECDGDYWHNLPGEKAKDRKRDKFFRSNGFKVIRIWEHEINQDVFKALAKLKGGNPK